MTAITTVVLFLVLASIEAKTDFSGYKLYQAKPASDEQKELLTQMDEYYPEDLVDFWSYPYDEKETVEFLVHGNLTSEIDGILDQHNVTFRVKFEDFQMIIDEQMRHVRDTQLEFDFRYLTLTRKFFPPNKFVNFLGYPVDQFQMKEKILICTTTTN